MSYYLVKTDPDTYSFATFASERQTLWDGVHNYQAIAHIKNMKPGDLVFVYESMTTKSIRGLAVVEDEPKLNTNDPRHSWVVTLSYVETFKTSLLLSTIKTEAQFSDMPLIKHSRLSVMPITKIAAENILHYCR
jgi:predicted RNA-binding protein with PUA-like domain